LIEELRTGEVLAVTSGTRHPAGAALLRSGGDRSPWLDSNL